MTRTFLVASIIALTAAAGCSSGTGDAPAPTSGTPAPSASAQPQAAAAAAPGEQVPGIPELSGTPTDLTAPTQAAAGTGAPPTGLLTQDVVVGTGPAATPSDTVDVRYTGTLYSDGTLFDSSWKRGDTPARFPLSQVIPGFTQGISGMQVGGRRVIVVPPGLGYGDQDNPPIPGGSTLTFVVDLVAIT